MPGLVGLIGADESSYAEMRRHVTSAGLSIGYPTAAEAIPGVLGVWRNRHREHPVLPLMLGGAGTVFQLSDVLSADGFQRSSFCQDFYRPRGVRYGLHGVIGRTTDCVAMIAVLRSGPDFSIRERSILELVQAPLSAVWSQVRARDRLARELSALIAQTHARPEGSEALTPAEDGVVDLVASGLTNVAAASALGISVKAVEQHLTHVYRKLSVASRTQMLLRLASDP
jgi:DNA-binding CsgD family transcriptional regulator